MGVQGWTFLMVGVSFATYIGVAVWSFIDTRKRYYEEHLKRRRNAGD